MIQFLEHTITRHTFSGDNSDVKTEFLISSVDSKEMQVVNDATLFVGGKEPFSMKSSLRWRLLTMLGLRGWENGPEPFTTDDRSLLGLPKKTMITEEQLNKLPINIIAEIGTIVQQKSVFTGDQAKN